MRKTSGRITAMHRMKRRWRKKDTQQTEKRWDIVEQRDRYQQPRVTNKQARKHPLNLMYFLYFMYRALNRIINLCNQLYGCSAQNLVNKSDVTLQLIVTHWQSEDSTSLTAGQTDSWQFKLDAQYGTPTAVLRLMTHYATRKYERSGSLTTRVLH
jgi:hypothetical protein